VDHEPLHVVFWACMAMFGLEHKLSLGAVMVLHSVSYKIDHRNFRQEVNDLIM